MSNIKNSNIQLLRAIAVLLVITQHVHRLPIPEWFFSTYKVAAYWTGVDIFLAISGYLMCKSLESEATKFKGGGDVFFSFLVKRVVRLMPALIFWCLICALMAIYLHPLYGVSLSKSLENLFYSMLGMSNILFYRDTIANVRYDPLISVTWSLSLEWQLYIILAFLFITFKKKWLSRVMAVIILLSSILLPNDVDFQRTIGWWIRPQAFFWGGLVYIFQSKVVIRSNILICLIFLLSILFLVFLTPIVPAPFKLFFIGLSGAATFASFSIFMPCVFHSRVLEWIGDRSYSIYLCHIPMMYITKTILDKWSHGGFLYQNIALYLIFFIIITAISSDLSYRFIERKFINAYKNKKCLKRIRW
ncbi:acyltransferase family protein [Serratia microhaemolytica]|uniref:acyltransferase family protein n=1 Tax=Serratia microhaemolytica TaxID=2675110 RepID=UPI000FDE4B03|nr:acyltransferase [Serratia microhaemolytica]